MRQIRGRTIGMIFQDPMTSLNPVKTIGWQLQEAVLIHQDVSKKEARRQAIDILKEVEIPRSDQRVDDYPHQFSGGMRQRVMIAMALINNPEILIADEPTTALDVTTQAQILRLMKKLQAEHETAIVMITHDLGVVAELADQVIVMYGGKVVEQANVDDLFVKPEMPYTWGLLGSLPRLNATGARLDPAARPPEAEAAPLDPGRAAVADQPAAGLQVPPPLPARVREVPRGACARESRRAEGPPRPLLADRRGEAPDA